MKLLRKLFCKEEPIRPFAREIIASLESPHFDWEIKDQVLIVNRILNIHLYIGDQPTEKYPAGGCSSHLLNRTEGRAVFFAANEAMARTMRNTRERIVADRVAAKMRSDQGLDVCEAAYPDPSYSLGATPLPANPFVEMNKPTLWAADLGKVVRGVGSSPKP